jgi:peptidoglycan/LPS O-acetylase OafA/YrhL
VSTTKNSQSREPEASLAQLTSHTPRRDIQGLRALAVILVVAFHAGWGVRGGFIGVDVFFVISGFVITGMLMRQLEARGTFSIRDFYSRRIKRLLPALALVVAVTLVLTGLLGAPFNGQQGITALTGGGAVLALANVVLIFKSGDYFETPPASNPLLNTWSLSVEEQFYLVFPFALLALWLIGRRIKRGLSTQAVLISGIAILTVASFVLSVAMSSGNWAWRFSSPESVAFYSAPTRAWEFGVGVIAALITARIRISSRVATPIFTLGVIAVIAAAFTIGESDIFPGAIALWPVLATAALLLTGDVARGSLTKVIRLRAAVSLGDLSYSWYLWHWPLIAMSLILWPTNSWFPTIAAFLSLALAWLTFRFVENPLRFSARLVGRRLVAFTATTIVAVLSLAALLCVGASNSWWNPNLTSMNDQVSAQHLWLTNDCNTDTPLGSRPESCTLNAQGSGKPIFLLGDSQAGMLSEAMAEVGLRDNRRVMLGTKGACPFILAEIDSYGKADEVCKNFVEESIAWLMTQRSGTAVISNWAAYTWLDGVGLASDGQPFTYTSQGKLDVMRAGLMSVVNKLRTSGHTVVLVDPIPGFPSANPEGRFWYPYQCHLASTVLDPATCGQAREQSDVQAELAPFNRMLDEIAAETGAAVLSLESELCTDGKCVTNMGNQWNYMDGQHISVRKSKELGEGPLTVG